MKRILCSLLLMLAVATTASAESEKPTRYFVYFENEQAMQQARTQLVDEVIHMYTTSPTLVVATEQINALQKLDGVVSVEADVALQHETHISAGVSGQTTANSWNVRQVNPNTAWSQGFKGKGVKVAVLDSGIDLSHPDLNVAGGVSYIEGVRSYTDDNGHGTHVAGIIAAKDDGRGTVGVAPDVSLYSVKVLDSEGIFYFSDLIKGIEWSIANDMDILNLSIYTWNYSPYKALEDALEAAYAQGIVLVGITGNSGEDYFKDTINYPGKYEEVIAVAAVDQYNRVADFSSYGTKNELAAPGVNIYSTLPNRTYGYMSGTSMAAPHVTGAVALLKQRYPHLTNHQLKKELLRLTKDVGATGWDMYYGHGVLDLSKWQSQNEVRQTVQTNDVKKSWTVTLSTMLASNALNNNTVFIMNSRGQKIATHVTVQQSFNTATLTITPQQNYTKNERYTLTVRDLVARNGSLLKTNITMPFKVY